MQQMQQRSQSWEGDGRCPGLKSNCWLYSRSMWSAAPGDGSLSESKTADRCSPGLRRDDDASLKTPAAAAAASRRDERSTSSETTETFVQRRSQHALSTLLARELRALAAPLLPPLSNAHPGSNSVTWSVKHNNSLIVSVNIYTYVHEARTGAMTIQKGFLVKSSPSRTWPKP